MKTEKYASEIWKQLKIAIVGGDEREQEIARRAVSTGAEVDVFGFPLPPEGIDGARVASSVEDALRDVRVALFPIPGIAADGSLFATEKIIPSPELLSVMAEDAHIVLGKSDSNLKRAASDADVTLHEYEDDRELMLLRAPAIVEGALEIAIRLTDVTIHRARICVVGYGNIGSVLARTLVALGGRVVVAARDPVQRASAFTDGADAIHTDTLAEHAADFDMIMSTVPAALVTPSVIDGLPAHALVMDLSAPPGGCDLDYAEQSGRPAAWARALGRRAPITVGASQWLGIVRIVEDLLGERSA